MIPKPPPRAPRVGPLTRREYRAKLSVDRPQTGPRQTSKRVQQIRIPRRPRGPSTLNSPFLGQRLPKRVSFKTQRLNRPFFAVSPAKSAVFAFRILLKKTGLNRLFCELVAPGRPAGRVRFAAHFKEDTLRVSKNPKLNDGIPKLMRPLKHSEGDDRVFVQCAYFVLGICPIAFLYV